MQIAILILIAFLVLGALLILARRKANKSSGGNAANTDSELESLYSLLGDNSGRMKK